MVTVNDKKDFSYVEKVNMLIDNLLNSGYKKTCEWTISECLVNEVLEKVVAETWLNPYKKIETTIHRKYKESVLVGYEIFNNRLTNEEF
jgi:hypothetical protein